MKSLVKKLKTKLSGRGGFSLVELLFSILILMLSTTVIIQCFSLGLGNVVRETRASEAQLLCSALTSSIQNELTYARDIKVSSGTNSKLVSYFSSSRRMGADSKLTIVDGQLKITSSGETYPLVASSNYTASNRAGVAGGGTYFLKAYLKDGAIQWDGEKFNVTLWVDDANKTALTADQAEKQALAYAQFSVKPLGGVKTE